jgi:adenylylsulfate kinase-like enzyme
MKYILTDSNGGIIGLFSKVEKVDNGYMCDDKEMYQTTVTGEVVVSEVSDDYALPQPEPEVIVKTDKQKTIEDIQAQIDALKGAA